MTDGITAAAAGAAAGAAAVAMIGLPAGNVVFGAAVGALASVWFQHATTAELTRSWLVRAVGSLAAALLAGVLAPVFIEAYAPSFSWFAPLLRIDSMILAMVGALCSHKAIGWVNRWFDRKSKD